MSSRDDRWLYLNCGHCLGGKTVSFVGRFGQSADLGAAVRCFVSLLKDVGKVGALQSATKPRASSEIFYRERQCYLIWCYLVEIETVVLALFGTAGKGTGVIRQALDRTLRVLTVAYLVLSPVHFLYYGQEPSSTLY
ncbi:hypothetical protein DPEC_G00340520 [Dallia pectoralis]|uniref:Uncharacterized protein n=1 Tax=Dallia pectoralis TaxID=75939 RepID=A0ACC2F551_DALPE|nr:hypothetical protein DPEC_G00340520 [Dallia pectoralis]